MRVRVLRAEPYHPAKGALMPILTQRILDYATKYVPEGDPVALATAVMTRVYAQDPAILLLALVDEQASVVGHVVAMLGQDGKRAWVSVPQYKADGNVGDAGLGALRMVEEWALQAGVPANAPLMLTTTQDDERWAKRGFDIVRYVQARSLNHSTSQG